MIYDHVNFNGRIQSTLNLSGIVGYGGSNRIDDVLLIQGFFNYISKFLSPGALGLGGEYNIPRLTGVMDNETHSAIVEFRKRNAGQLLTDRFAARIHPASYKGRKLHTDKRYMAITLLHVIATETSRMAGHYDYIKGLMNLNPVLARSIDMAIVMDGHF